MTIATSTKPPLHVPVIIFMAVVHIGALFALLPSNFSWAAVGLAIFLHWVTGCLGITLGWHRLVAHRSFQVPKWIEYCLVFCGTLACQSGPLEWIGLHRHHHAYSDQKYDHHNSGEGFWWSHMGWMFHQVPVKQEMHRFTKDIADDPVYQFLEKYFFPIQLAFAALLYLIGGWPFVIWGIFARLVMVYHCTWLVNSATHKFGYQTYDSGDKSTNCWWVALLTYGEGWHNNHHAFQYSARHGMQWWEFDLTWMIIRGLQMLGLATNIKLRPEV
ncbi:MAG: acyl-CoA desaturase [Cyanothece sp. SIO1E1]|nr:acyl-CoA desaturase [Cyanothece sp. SIO1E1]